jgi:predicted amidohydrolase
MTSTEDVAGNLEQAAKYCADAAAAGAKLVVLPENFGFLGPVSAAALAWAKPLEHHPFLAPLREVAKGENISIIAGGLPEVGPDSQHAYNTSVVLGPDGQVQAAYRKIHLFDVALREASFRESHHMAPGAEVVHTDVGAWRVGLSICYDIRFGELYRALSSAGADILTVPAAFALHTGKDHWSALLRARAIEHQCYLIAAAQSGRHHATRQSWGKSMIVDPWGTVLACAPEYGGFVLATCDAAYMQEVRALLPCLGHRRFGVAQLDAS